MSTGVGIASPLPLMGRGWGWGELSRLAMPMARFTPTLPSPIKGEGI